MAGAGSSINAMIESVATSDASAGALAQATVGAASTRRSPEGPTIAHLVDGRWHLQHGPIDLIIAFDGDAASRAIAIDRGWQRFKTILVELMAELPLLRRNGTRAAQLRSPIAARMAGACWPYHRNFGLYVTPMAAVAGSVAQEVLRCIAVDGVRRAYVNNGGDIALYLAPAQSYRIGIVADLDRAVIDGAAIDGAFRIEAASAIRGVATSGWRGRSLSLGVADAVTVLARDAAAADAAATMIANHVNIDSPRIVRRAACDVRDQSDLGEIPVTVAVASLRSDEVDAALDNGCQFAQRLLVAGLIEAAVLLLAGRSRVVAAPSLSSLLPQCADP